ncbi:MAG: PspC domain-containing protein [Thermoleophilia bacterium]|nr:PspC domain-containing protein [Thermoleophilia bacterium]
MKRVSIVNLAGRAYHVEEAGVAVIGTWLETARTRLAGDPGRDELLLDFERAIAERCDDVTETDRDVVTAEAVTAILAALGEVEPAANTGEPSAGDGEPNANELPRASSATGSGPAWRDRKLYRFDTRDDSMVAGVAAGMAAYLNVDVTIVRVAWIILSFLTSGVAIALYIVLAFVLPKADTPEKRAAAHGSGTTAQEMISRARDGAGPALQSLGARLTTTFRAAAKVVHLGLIAAVGIVVTAWAVQVMLILVNGGGVSSAFDPGTSRGLIALWVSCFAWITCAALLAVNSLVASFTRSPERTQSRGRNRAIGWSSGIVSICAIIAIAAIPAASSRQLSDLSDGRGTVRLYEQTWCITPAHDTRRPAGVRCDEFVQLD